MRKAEKKDLRRKTYLLSEDLIKRAQDILGARTETETVTRALEYIAFEKEVLKALHGTAGKGRGHFDLSLYGDWKRAAK